jgi:hypothetical protein
MTPDQQKELDAIIDAVYSSYSQRSNTGMCYVSSAHMRELKKYLKAYADHFSTIKAIESGEWVLMPVDPEHEMLCRAFREVPDRGIYMGYIKQKYKDIIAAVQKARPKIGGE